MPIPLNTPISGRIREAFEKKFEKAKSKRDSSGNVLSKGEWYEIFKSHNLFDVDDSPVISQEQRDMVPKVDWYHQSDVIDSLIECMESLFMGSFFDGVGDTIQNLIDKALIKAMMADGKINGLASTVSAMPIPGAQIVKVANDTMGALISTAQGMSPYDLDVIPRLTFGMPSLSVDFGNILKPGYIMPDWLFIRRQETAHPKFYHSGKESQGLILGVGIDMGSLDEAALNKVFVVNSTDSFGKPTGDMLTGLSPKEFNAIKLAIGVKGQDAMTLLDNPNIKDISLHEGQIIGSFARYVEMSYWNPLNNPENWIHAHWGAISNNAFPSGLRTAIASYNYNHGSALTPSQTDISAYISYCIEMGMHYKAGYEFPTAYTLLSRESEDGTIPIDPNLTTTIDGTQYNVKYSTEQSGVSGEDFYANENTPIMVDRIDRNGSIANIYFTLACDLLSRRTYSSVSDNRVSRGLRKRRVDEANLFYSEVFGPDKVLEYGKSPNTQAYEHSNTALQERYFQSLINAKILRYDNVNRPGTADNGQKPSSGMASIGYTDSDYVGVYAPQIEFRFSATLRKLRFWNMAIINDKVVEDSIDG